MAEPNSKPEGEVARARLRGSAAVFTLIMVALTFFFVALGLWQIARWGEKLQLISDSGQRVSQSPIAFPPVAEWQSLDGETLQYRPLAVSGTFLPAQTILVFTSIGEARGQYSGPGYWVMTPLAVSGGGIVFVNRGFIPQSSAEAFVRGGTVPEGVVDLVGLARLSEATTAFTPGTDRANRIEWVRDVDRLAALLPPDSGPVAPLTLDLPAGERGALPQGGETVLSFPNNHLGYAITWFGFALITPVLLAVWLLRRGREKPMP
jgi:surfeit locus 1 family protein